MTRYVRFPIEKNIKLIEDQMKKEILKQFPGGRISILPKGIEIAPGMTLDIMNYDYQDNHNLHFRLIL